ncbi:indole-3-glycerol phosphate synthase [Alteribacillus persepolensis]|uniref:Indole-3-glycerol phosphate synthase n=1 Tax=Alteribacillus persepolensis TaxID=568899 RepID=A0A1G7ZFQ8_9BACI|nr:indole-3-glycerol phosphate synthase TrpC [Alteribacillus persepolensis]SDH07479.1 indole-3-glycerol phosphate synthase [Alteribacillus persepolensis]
MLNKILETKKEEIQQLVLPEKQDVKRYSLKEALTSNAANIQVIAEVKKASPSKGLIRADFQPESIAKSYQNGGAAALSVLTDQSYFQGKREYLTQVKHNVSIPVMRKEFIIDRLQIEESVRIGADAVLLIAAALEPKQLHELYLEAYEKGLEVLVECHSRQEVEDVLKTFEPAVMGINNRDLRTFHTTLDVTKELGRLIPSDSILVSESGIYTAEDLQLVQQFGAQAVLVGESLMRQPDVEAALRTLKGEYQHDSSLS